MATSIARPRQPSSGYKNKYYDPVKAHRYYLGKRKLKGYKDRYKNSDRRRKRSEEDDTELDAGQRQKELEKARLDEEREQEQLLEEAELREEEDESSQQIYAHTGDKRTGIHAARGWTVMQAQAQAQAARGFAGKVNASIAKSDEGKELSFVPDGYDVSEEVRAFIERYDDLSSRIRAAVGNLDPGMQASVTSKLKELDDRMKNLVAGAVTLGNGITVSSKTADLRRRVDRYNRALGR